MPDLKERLRGIDQLAPPDLWEAARARAEAATSDSRGVSTTRRLVTIGVALGIGLGGVVALLIAFDQDSDGPTPAAPLPSRIVFSTATGPDHPGQLYSMNPDGSAIRQITSGTESYSSVALSPDGRRIAYVRLDGYGQQGPTGPEAIYVANPDDTGASEIYRSSETPQSVVDLDWSPDGGSIGFILRSIPVGGGSEAGWTYRLWIMGADGSDPHPVSDEQITSFSFAPSGDRFAVTRELVDGVHFVDDIFVLGLDGSFSQLTAQGASRNPIWSPDGARILFEQGWSSVRTMVMLADGSDIRRLSEPRDRVTEPLTWNADSTQILVRTIERYHCAMIRVDLSGGGTFTLSEGSDAGIPCVQSASWVGSDRLESQSTGVPQPANTAERLTPAEVLTRTPLDPQVAVRDGWPVTVKQIQGRAIAWYQDQGVASAPDADLERAIDLLTMAMREPPTEKEPDWSLYVREMAYRREAACRSLPPDNALRTQEEYCSPTSMPELDGEDIPWADS